MHLSFQHQNTAALQFRGRYESPSEGSDRVQRERIQAALQLLGEQDSVTRQFIGRDYYPKQAVLRRNGQEGYMLTIGPVAPGYNPDETYYFSGNGEQVRHQQFNLYLPKPASPEGGLYGQLGQFLKASETLSPPSGNTVASSPDERSLPGFSPGFSIVG